MKTACGTLKTVGKGSILVNIGDNINIEAYYAPECNSKIIANRVLSKLFEVHYCPTEKHRMLVLYTKLGPSTTKMRYSKYSVKINSILFRILTVHSQMTYQRCSSTKKNTAIGMIGQIIYILKDIKLC